MGILAPKNAATIGFVAAIILTTGCKTVLREDLEKLPKNQAQIAQEAKTFLGIVVLKETPAGAEGVKIERILKASPAEKADLKPGDVIRILSGRAIASTADLEQALQEQGRGDEVELLITRKDLERNVKLTLTSFGDYNEIAVTRVTAYSKANSEDFPYLSPIVLIERQFVPENMWLEFFGQRVTERVLLYENVDIIAIPPFFSIYRVERTDRLSAERSQYFFQPFVYTNTGEVDVHMTKLAEGEEKYKRV